MDFYRFWCFHLESCALDQQLPDDALLGAVLTKLFNDRQLRPTPDTIPYLVRQIDRSFDAARQVVSALDQAALVNGRNINRALAREVLQRN